jgi:SnoaL-like domain
MSDELAVQQVLARYVRAHDWRDGTAMRALFTSEALASSTHGSR